MGNGARSLLIHGILGAQWPSIWVVVIVVHVDILEVPACPLQIVFGHSQIDSLASLHVIDFHLSLLFSPGQLGILYWTQVGFDAFALVHGLLETCIPVLFLVEFGCLDRRKRRSFIVFCSSQHVSTAPIKGISSRPPKHVDSKRNGRRTKANDIQCHGSDVREAHKYFRTGHIPIDGWIVSDLLDPSSHSHVGILGQDLGGVIAVKESSP